jgi:hypothetical protein
MGRWADVNLKERRIISAGDTMRVNTCQRVP